MHGAAGAKGAALLAQRHWPCVCSSRPMRWAELEVRVADGAGVREDVADVVDAGEVHDEALEPQAEAGVVAGAVAAEVQVVLVLVLLHAELLDAALEDVEALLALGAADDLSDAGDEAVRGGDRLAVVVLAHVERLDVLGVVGDERGLLEVLLREVALVLGLEVDAPLDRVLELVAGRLGVRQDLDGVRVGDAREVACGDVLQALLQALVHELVEHVELIRAVLHHVVDDVLEHLLGHIHLALEIAERHLGLDHPELRRVATGVGVLRAERGAERVDVAEAHGEVLCLELAGDGEVGLLAEEVLAVVDLAVLGKGRVGRVDRGDAEHLSGALGI